MSVQVDLRGHVGGRAAQADAATRMRTLQAGYDHDARHPARRLRTNHNHFIEIGDHVHLQVVELIRAARGEADADRVGDLRIMGNSGRRIGNDWDQHVIDEVAVNR